MASYDDPGLEASRLRDLDTRLTKLEQAHAHSGSRAAKAILDLKGLEELGSAAEARLEIGDEDPFETLTSLATRTMSTSRSTGPTAPTGHLKRGRRDTGGDHPRDRFHAGLARRIRRNHEQ